MADFLRRGATLTKLSCPSCSSPLLRLRNKDLLCAICQKKVIVVKQEDTQKSSPFRILDSILLGKIEEIIIRIEKTNDTNELEKLSNLLSNMLNNIEKVRSITSKS
jgi:uncharacterized Zn finger protein (UPF0148 family)